MTRYSPGVLVLLALALLSCAEPDPSPAIEVVEGVAFWRVTDPAAPLTEFGLTAVLESGGIVCRRRGDGDPVHCMTFEREGEQGAYGVYAIAGAKNGIPVDPPLSGEAINWPDRDETQGLIHLLTLAGVEAPRAARFVEARREQLFAEGLRVLFVLLTNGRPTVLALELAPA